MTLSVQDDNIKSNTIPSSIQIPLEQQQQQQQQQQETTTKPKRIHHEKRSVKLKAFYRDLERTYNNHKEAVMSENAKKGHNNNDTPKRKKRLVRQRSTLTMIYQAVERCKEPSKTYQIMAMNSTEKTREIIYNMVKHGLIEAYVNKAEYDEDIAGLWVITDKGRQFLKDVDEFNAKWPILTEHQAGRE